MSEKIEASFSALVISIASNAAMYLGLSPNPMTGKNEPDSRMAQFNIDLLSILKEKTKNNLSEEENKLITSLVNDLQMKFVSNKKPH